MEEGTVKRSKYKSKRKPKEQFRRKMNPDESGNRKPFWKKLGNVEGRKIES